MNVKSNVLIFSVFQKSSSLVSNATSHARVVKGLQAQNIPFVELRGKYEGVEELSILVEGFSHRPLVESLCKEFKQECYLESHNDRASFLVFPNGDKTAVGTLQGVTKEVAEAHGSYSYNPLVGQHYVTMF